MYRIQLALVVFAATILSACGPSSLEPDPELYGSWVHPEYDGEITLREDGTLNWFGREGTWRVVDNSGYLQCNPLLPSVVGFCDKRLIVEGVDGAEGMKYFSRSIQAEPNRFSFGDVTNLIDENDPSSDLGGFLWRKGSFPENFMPAPFERLTETPFEEPSFDLPEDDLSVRSNNSLIYAYRWDTGGNDMDSSVHTSIDGGSTWQSLPELSFDQEAADRFSSSTRLVDTHVIRSIRYEQEIEGPDWVFTHQDIWAIDAADETPSWTLIRSLTGTGNAAALSDPANSSVITYTQTSNADDTTKLFVSHDYGTTWQNLEYPCASNSWHALTHREDGLYCKTQPGNELLHWYAFDTQTWTAHSVPEHARNQHYRAEFTDELGNPGVYFLDDDQQLWSWTFGEAENFVLDAESLLPGGIHSRIPYELDISSGWVLVHHYGLWGVQL